MYKIFWANLDKAGYKGAGKRPVVLKGAIGGKLRVLAITSRNKNDKFHVHMNNYIVRGYCDCGTVYTIDKKFLASYVRECTTQEQAAIDQKCAELRAEKEAV